jgi:ABC-type lipoprotein release transport system permease subunit
MLFLKLAWRNIWRNQKRTWITASSIGFAVFFAAFMQSMQLGSYQRMIDNAVRFYTGHLAIHQEEYWDEKILDNGMEQRVINNLEINEESLDVAVPRLTSFALASYKEKTKGVLMNGIDPVLEAKLTYLDNKVISGSYMTGQGVLVAEGLSEYLNVNVGDTIVFISQGYHGVNAAGKYLVEGILKFPVPDLNQSAVYLPLALAQDFFGAEGIITSYSMLMEDPKELQSYQASLKEDAAEAGLDVMNWEEMMPELIQGIELDYYGGLIMIYILYAVIGFGILGTFLMMTKERTYEFGVLVSIGMKKSKIQYMVGMEIILLTFFGVFLGLIASFPLTLYFFYNPIEFTGEAAKAYESFGYEPIIPFSLDPVIFYSQGLAILVISIFLGLYPMVAISKLKIIKALKE